MKKKIRLRYHGQDHAEQEIDYSQTMTTSQIVDGRLIWSLCD